jgi:hypothetical protein
MLRDRSFGDTSNAATVAVTKRDVSLLMEKMKNIFFQIRSETPRVVTAMVAVFDVSHHGLSRNVKYCSTTVHFLLTAKFVYIVYFFPAFLRGCTK